MTTALLAILAISLAYLALGQRQSGQREKALRAIPVKSESEHIRPRRGF